MQIRVAPSLGALEGDPEKVWGGVHYVYKDRPVVFFGLYGLPDFYELWRHEGKKYILWAGSDIRHFKAGYWLEDKPDGAKVDPKGLALWISRNCESWVENDVEYQALKELGIESKICPSFMGNVNDYEVTYKPSDRPKIYTSVSGNDFDLYGWWRLPAFAQLNPNVEFHLYGNTVEWKDPQPNIIVHGRVPKEQMNAEIKDMQGCLRLVEFDGFSEIVAKALLWGQYPISAIDYPHCFTKMSPFPDKPNIEGRNWLLSVVNKYPWNELEKKKN